MPKLLKIKVAAPPNEKRGRRLAAGLGALVLGLAGLVTGTSAASASTTPDVCSGGIFISVRGTGAPGGSGLIHNGRAWTSGGEGDQVAALKSYAVSSPIPFYFESLAYPASIGAGYIASSDTGTTMLVDELNYYVGACRTYTPAIVLAGHSQGAEVIMRALAANNGMGSAHVLSGAARSAIKAVELFGDPGYDNADPFDMQSDPYNGINPRGDDSAQINMRHWGYPQSGGSTQTWVYTIQSWCKANDAFCQQPSNDPNYTIHNSYKNNMSAPWAGINFRITSTG